MPYPIALASIITVVCLSGCDWSDLHPSWPPAVTSMNDIVTVPESARDLRAVGVGDKEVLSIATRFQNLEYLYTSSNSRVSDAGIQALARSTRLTQLVIENGERLTDESTAVVCGLPSLKILIITSAPQLSDRSLELLGACKQMERIYLFDCPKLSDSARSSLHASLPACDIRFHK